MSATGSHIRTGWVVLVGQIIGNSESWQTVYAWDEQYWPTQEEAITAGFRLAYGTDDFNVGYIHRGELTWFGWMDIRLPTEDYAAVAKQFGWSVANTTKTPPSDAGPDGGHPAAAPTTGQPAAESTNEPQAAPLPGQPDGIDTESHDLPDPRKAAERIREYVAESGDGLYDSINGKPLYGRDLDSVTRLILSADGEDVVERVARAMFERDGINHWPWADVGSAVREGWRANARAAVRALRGERMLSQRDDLTFNTPPWPDGPHYLDHDTLLAKVLERDFIDYPTGWAIQAAGLTHTDARCSAVQSSAFLCDCGAVESRWAVLRTEAQAHRQESHEPQPVGSNPSSQEA